MIRFPVAALTISVCLVVLLCTAGESFALPPCQGNDESKWQNCEGTLTSHSGKVYVGIFKDGTFDGENAEHGIKWVGGYKNGTLNGQGTLTFFPPSEWVGSKFVGEVSLGGKFHGQGTYTYAAGNKTAMRGPDPEAGQCLLRVMSRLLRTSG